jgi:hypothetical protein
MIRILKNKEQIKFDYIQGLLLIKLINHLNQKRLTFCYLTKNQINLKLSFLNINFRSKS